MLKQSSVFADMEIPKELIERMKRQKVVAIPYDKEGIRSEAIKEFAERLKTEMLGKHCLHFNGEITEAIIDSLQKEMVGDSA